MVEAALTTPDNPRVKNRLRCRYMPLRTLVWAWN